MGFFSLAAGGLGFILIGACEALSFPSPKNPNPNHIQTSPISNPNQSSSSSSPSTISLVFASLLSSLVVLNSLFSFFDAISSRDQIGSAFQLQTLAVASLFLLHSVAGILSRSSASLPFPSLLIDSIAIFAFAEEFLLFYLQRKDTSGIENRYFDLVLVPIGICVVSSAIGVMSSSPDSVVPRLGRAAGLVLQGTWLVQMAVSFHTGMIADGCSVHTKSRGNFTVKCKSHGDYHRARAIATLQFNCHLALIVTAASLLFSLFPRSDNFSSSYRPIAAAEMRAIDGHTRTQFTLDSDEDDRDKSEIDEDERNGSVEIGVNGHK